MALGDADLPAMLAELGVDVILQGPVQITTRGILDEFDEDHGDDPGFGSVLGKSRAVTIRTDSLPSIEAGSTVMVDGLIRKVREVRQLDDGALTRITLVEET